MINRQNELLKLPSFYTAETWQKSDVQSYETKQAGRSLASPQKVDEVTVTLLP
jgi:hypothetical protein